MVPSPLPRLPILPFLLNQFLWLYPQDLRDLADGLRTGLLVAVLQPLESPVGEVGHPGEFPLGEDPLLPQPLQLLHIDLHSPKITCPYIVSQFYNIISI